MERKILMKCNLKPLSRHTAMPMHLYSPHTQAVAFFVDSGCEEFCEEVDVTRWPLRMMVMTYGKSIFSVACRSSILILGCIWLLYWWKSWSASSPCVHNPHTSSTNRKYVNGCLVDLSSSSFSHDPIYVDA